MNIRSSTVLLALLLAALPAAAQTLDWTSVASAGVPYNGNGISWSVSGPTIFIAPNIVSTVEFRYPVTNTYGSANSKQPGWTTFSMTYSDNSSTAGSVTANLMEVDACSATERQICTLTSQDGDGTKQCDTSTLYSSIDFSSHSYYIYVTIVKTDTPADPRLHELAIY